MIDKETFDLIVKAQKGKTILGKYVIEGGLGFGGFGVVFKCKEILGNVAIREVAVKKISLSLIKGSDLDSFLLEVNTMIKIGLHQNILQFITADMDAEHLYIVTEFADGGTLRGYLDEKKYLIEQEAVDIAIQILSGIEIVHQQGIIHRDLKPANIFIVKNHYKVGDFGVSKIIDDNSMASTMIGSPFYMCREQIIPKMKYGKNVDIYAAGVILHEMLTGRKPFTTLEAICNEQPVSLPITMSQPLQKILQKALHKISTKRYQECREMIEDLVQFRKTLPTSDKTPQVEEKKYINFEVTPVNTEPTANFIPELGNNGNSPIPLQPINDINQTPINNLPKSALPKYTNNDKVALYWGGGLIGVLIIIISCIVVFSLKGETLSYALSFFKKSSPTISENISNTKLNEVELEQITPMEEKKVDTEIENKIDNSISNKSDEKEEGNSENNKILITDIKKGGASPQELTEWLDMAKFYWIKDISYTSSDKEKSATFLKKVLDNDPKNREALDWQRKITLEYVTEATQKYQKREYEKALEICNVGIKFTYNDRKLITLKEEIEKKLDSIKSSNNEIKKTTPLTEGKEYSEANIVQGTSRVNSVKSGMVYIPAGNYQTKDGEVYVKGYYIDIYEYPNIKGEKPKGNVTWYEARNYCVSQGKRLCSEVEWEVACKGGKNYTYPYGNTFNEKFARVGLSDEAGPAPSGSYEESRSGYGLYDLSGNLWEWTESGSSSNRIAKGGAWNNNSTTSQCEYQLLSLPNYKNATMGFRCCK